MKITDFAICFLMVCMCLFVRLDIKVNNLEAISEKKVQYDNALNTAVDDAVLKLID